MKDIVANECWCIISLMRSVWGWGATESDNDVCSQKQGVQTKIFSAVKKKNAGLLAQERLGTDGRIVANINDD